MIACVFRWDLGIFELFDRVEEMEKLRSCDITDQLVAWKSLHDETMIHSETHDSSERSNRKIQRTYGALRHGA